MMTDFNNLVKNILTETDGDGNVTLVHCWRNLLTSQSPPDRLCTEHAASSVGLFLRVHHILLHGVQFQSGSVAP